MNLGVKRSHQEVDLEAILSAIADPVQSPPAPNRTKVEATENPTEVKSDPAVQRGRNTKDRIQKRDRDRDRVRKSQRNRRGDHPWIVNSIF